MMKESGEPEIGKFSEEDVVSLKGPWDDGTFRFSKGDRGTVEGYDDFLVVLKMHDYNGQRISVLPQILELVSKRPEGQQSRESAPSDKAAGGQIVAAFRKRRTRHGIEKTIRVSAPVCFAGAIMELLLSFLQK
jgi:hypothetical protein